MDALLEVQEAAIDQLQGMQFDLTASSASTDNQGLPSACLPCRRMALELSSAAENLLTENHDAALALEATTLALAELELHSRIIDRKAKLNPNQVPLESSSNQLNGDDSSVRTTGQISLQDVNLCIEFLPSIISFQEQTTKLLKTIQDAEEAYAQSEEFEYHEPGPKVLKATNADQTSSTTSDWGCAVSCALLHNSGLAYSMLYCPAAALQAYMAALSAAQLMSDQDRACAIKYHVLRRVEDIASHFAEHDAQAYRNVEEIRQELRNAEVAMLARCPSAARAA